MDPHLKDIEREREIRTMFMVSILGYVHDCSCACHCAPRISCAQFGLATLHPAAICIPASECWSKSLLLLLTAL